MKKIIKVISLLLVFTMLVSVLPVNMAAAATPTVYTINNGYIQYSINTETGGFSIATLTGHPQKKYDDNKTLLYKGDGTETSFTTIRIDDVDYIFGQDYGFLGMNSKLDQPIINYNENSISTKWSITTKKGTVSITQKVMISSDPNNDLCGNAGVGYTVQNLGQPAKIAIRTLLDSAIGNLDAPYLVKDADLIPTIFEKEYSTSNGDLPTQIRGMDNTLNPTAMSYVLLKGWTQSQAATPTRAIIGHWANLVNTRFEYTPDNNCEFVNYSNAYKTPDSAVALYWDGKTIAKNATMSAEFLYGIGNFSSQLSESEVNIDMNVGTVNLTADKKGYENGGKITVTATIDNSVDNSKDIAMPIVQISLEKGLRLENPNREAETLADIKKGESRTVTWDIIADPQTVASAKEIAITLVTKTTSYSANRFLIVPSATGNLPKVEFTKVTPDKFYFAGDKNFNLSGSINELINPLKGKTGWDLVLLHNGTGERTVIDKDTVAFVGETNKSISFSTDAELLVGDYSIVFEFTDSNLKKVFGNNVTVPQKIEVNLDKSLMCKRYGILTVERYQSTKYKVSTFLTEESLNDYIQANGLDTKPTESNNGEREMLLQIRGSVKEFVENGKTYYSADPSNEDVTINGVVQYGGTEPLVIEQTGDSALVKGKGNLSVINYLTFWKSNFQIQFKAGAVSTLDSDITDMSFSGSPSKSIVKIEYTGVGTVIQKIAAFTINLKYGELISTWDDSNKLDGYAIDFGGKLALSFLPSQSKKNDKDSEKKEKDKKDADKKDTNKDDEDDEDDDKITLGADIQNVIYAQTDDGVKFKGIRGEFEFGLPENAMGGMIKNPPIEASLSIDTIDNVYEVSFGVDVKIIECSGTLRVKVVNIKGADVPLPDKFELSVASEVGVPIVPPILQLKGLTGGYDNLADTVTGNYVGSLPPITLILGAKIGLIEIFEGDLRMELGLTKMKLEGKLTIAKIKGIELTGGLAAQWVDPFYIYAYGEINVFDILIGGVSLTIADNYFYGYGYLILKIPEKIPLIGGTKLAELEAAISNQLVGVNIRILGIGFGVVYYWSDGDVDFGGTIDLKPKPMMRAMMVMENNVTAEGDEYTALYGTNMRRLTATPVAQSNRMLMATRGMPVSKIDRVINATGQEAILLEIPYTGATDPTALNTTLTVDGKNMPLVQDESLSGGQVGNFFIQEREKNKYLYISVTDSSLIGNKTYTLSCTDTNITFADMTANGVDNLPELKSVEATKQSSTDIKADWEIAYEGVKTEDSEVTLYLTKDKNAINTVKNANTSSNADLGIKLGTFPAKNKTATVTIPDTCPSGDYYIIASMTIPDAGASIKINSTPISFENTLLPVKVSKVNISNSGDESIEVSTDDPTDADYTNYMVELRDESGELVTNSQFMAKKGEKVKIGPKATKTMLEGGKRYTAYVQTVKEINSDKSYINSEPVASELFMVAEANPPKLLAIEKNIAGNGEKCADNELRVKYTFDQPVKLSVYSNNNLISSGTEYKQTWDITCPLIDGDYVITVFAQNTQGDTYASKLNETSSRTAMLSRSADISEKDSVLTFSIDVTPPVLKITSQESMNAAGDKKIPVNSQAIRAKDGTVVIEGLSEKGVKLQLDGSSSGITVDAEGNFTISRKVDFENGIQKALKLTAEDMAGNKNETVIYALNADIASFESFIIKRIENKSAVDIDNKLLELKTGESTNLALYANYILTDGSNFEIPFNAKDVTWSLMGGNYVGEFNDGTLNAVAPGTVYLKASYPLGIYGGSDGSSAVKNMEDMVTVKVSGEPVVNKKQENTKLDSAYDALDTLTNNFLNMIGYARHIISIRLSPVQPLTGYLTESTTYFAPPGTTSDMDMLVVYRDENNDSLKKGIRGGKALTDAMRFELMKNESFKLPITLTYKLKTTEDGTKIALYKYNKWFNDWEYIDGVYNKGDKTVSAQVKPDGGIYMFLNKDTAQKNMLDISTHWAKSYVNSLSSLNVISGVDTKSGVMFYPNNYVTRAEFIKMAVCAMKVNINDYEDVQLPFDDLDKIPSWAIPYLKVAFKEGWVEGVRNGSQLFVNANNKIARQEVVAILFRIRKIEARGETIKFTDDDKIADYAKQAVSTFSSYNIVSGYPNGEFAPSNNVLRGEAAKILYYWINNILSQ